MIPRFPIISMKSSTSSSDSITATTKSNFENVSSSTDIPRVPLTADNDSVSFLTDNEWWANAIEEDAFDSPLAFDASESGLWNGRFVPPPPRPPFLDNSVTSDGLTTCDLCTWAWRERNLYSFDSTLEASGGWMVGWTFTLIIVSIISALVGAIIMVIFLRCRRLKSGNNNGSRSTPWWYRNNRTSHTGRNIPSKHPTDSIRRPTSNSGVWTWLSNRRPSSGPEQIGPPSTSPAENHYTHMDDTYTPVGVGEALYAELDRESVQSNNPSYQNTAYSQCDEVNDQDIPMVSSAPSSAYYSDLSMTAIPSGNDRDRAYEVVGLTVLSSASIPHWDTSGDSSGGSSGGLAIARRTTKLAAINESGTTPSDYV